MSDRLSLISHHLCPYVQRAVIALSEKGVDYEKIAVDLADKPDWFLEVSPLGKTPVLLAGGTAIFESNVILEYLEETQPHPLYPADPLERAEHRAWIEFGSSVLAAIASFYVARDAASFREKSAILARKFGQLEDRLTSGRYFAGDDFSLVDAVFGRVFRYFDLFDRLGDFAGLAGRAKLARWRRALAQRPSVRRAVGEDYQERLRRFLEGRGSHLSGLLDDAERMRAGVG